MNIYVKILTLKTAFCQLVSTWNGSEFNFVLSYFRHHLVSRTLLLCRLVFYFPSLLQQQLRIGHDKVSQQKITARLGSSIDAMLLWVVLKRVYSCINTYSNFLFSLLISDDGVPRSYGMDYVSPVTPVTVNISWITNRQSRQGSFKKITRILIDLYMPRWCYWDDMCIDIGKVNSLKKKFSMRQVTWRKKEILSYGVAGTKEAKITSFS